MTDKKKEGTMSNERRNDDYAREKNNELINMAGGSTVGSSTFDSGDSGFSTASSSFDTSSSGFD